MIGYALVATGVLIILAIGCLIPMPYVIEGPGPTFNVLGKDGKHDIISVKGAPSYDTSGALRMVTVSMRGGPGSHVTGFETLWALMSPDEDVYPVDDIYPPSMTASQVQEMSAAQMEGSQVNAKVAALTELGKPVPATMRVAGVAPDSPARGKLAKDDVITAVRIGDQRSVLSDAATLFRLLEATSPSTPVTLEFTRKGNPREVTVKGRKRPDGTGVMLGIYLDPQIRLPVSIDVALDNVGGPSAGMMFALGIIDTMTPDSLTKGHVIAGTGAVSMGGGVQMISGVPQKMLGAFRAGARWFMLPRGNCGDAAGEIPEGMRVVPVDNLHEAREAVEDIASGATANLPRCPAS